jgi:hypothetical protein
MVSLGGATLGVGLFSNFTPAPGSPFTIINNGSSTAVSGTFASLPEGAVLQVPITGSANTTPFQITYRGGDGNDVVLTALDPANPVLQGTSSDDTWLVKRNTDNVDVTLNGNLIASLTYASLSTLTINGLAGNDNLTVDASAGDPFPTSGITFHGGGNNGDRLITTGNPNGTTYTKITTNYFSGTPTFAGSIALSGSSADTLSYDGVRLGVDISGSAATNLAFQLPPTASNAFLEDDGTTGNNKARLRSSSGTFATTVFSNPSGSVSISRGTASDTLTVNNLSSADFSAGLMIGAAGAEVGAVTFSGGLTLAADKSLSVNAIGIISLPNPGSKLAVTGAGAISLTTAKSISLVSGSLSSVNGPITLSANQQATPTSGSFSGIDILEGTIQATGTGAVTVQGTGGNATSDLQCGVKVTFGAIKGGTNGPVTVKGTGGAGSGYENDGVRVDGSGATISSNGADISVTGYGGGIGGATTNDGVLIYSGGRVSAGGNGTVLLQGTGGNGSGNFNMGVEVGSGSVTSSGGKIHITGVAGGLGTSGLNVGVEVYASQVTASGNATITVEGTGGTGSGDYNYGVWVDGLGSGITSSDGNVQITGVEGAGTSGTGIIVGGGLISSGISSANVTLVSNSIYVGSASAIGAGSGSVTIKPYADGVATELGSTTDPIGGPLSLSDAELDCITAGTISIGAGSTGPVTIGAPIDRAAGSTTAIALTTGTNNNIAFTGTGSIDAKNGSVTLSADPAGSGAIRSTSSAAAVVLAASVSLFAGSGGIGASGNPLIVSAANLNTATAGNGNQFLAAAGSTNIDPTGLSAGTGTIELDGGTFALAGDDRIDDNSTLRIARGTFDIGASSDTIGSLAFGAGGTLAVAINTSAGGTQNGQLIVTSGVNLSAGNLMLSGTFSHATAGQLMLVQDDGTSGVVGSFVNLVHNLLIIPSGPLSGAYHIDTAGGDGNDVVLAAVNTPPTFARGPEETARSPAGQRKRQAMKVRPSRLPLGQRAYRQVRPMNPAKSCSSSSVLTSCRVPITSRYLPLARQLIPTLAT